MPRTHDLTQVYQVANSQVYQAQVVVVSFVGGIPGVDPQLEKLKWFSLEEIY